jgi:xylulokinase
MVRAVLESIGFAIRDVIGVMSENDAELEELRITGGPSKSALWNQIKADITGKRILIPESTESELLGNLVLALDTLGDDSDKAAAADRVVKIKKIFEPNRDNYTMYSDYFELYRESYKQLKEIFGSLKKLG